MSDLDDYNELLPKITALENGEEPSIPVEVMSKEGSSLCSWVQKDEAKFHEVNFNWDFVTSLPKRIGALRYAEVCWDNAWNRQAAAQKQLNELRPKVTTKINDAFSTMEYAFDNNDDLLGRLSKLKSGSSNDNLVMDCTGVKTLALEGKSLLDSINYDFSKVEELANMAGPLGTLEGQADASKLDKSEEKIIRDKAYAYCKEAIEKIRKCGKYVNREDVGRLKGYFSAYIRKQNRKYYNKKKNQKKEITQTTKIAPAAPAQSSVKPVVNQEIVGSKS